VTEAFILGSFNDPHQKTKDLDKFKAIKELHLITEKDTIETAKAAEQGQIIAEAVNLCELPTSKEEGFLIHRLNLPPR
jgi:hypothetical protein